MSTILDPVKAVNAILTEKLGIALPHRSVSARMDGQSLVIEGTVGSIAHKKRLLYHAIAIEGVEGVIDRVRVRQSSRIGDADIKKHFADAIAWEDSFRGLEITAEVSDGVVDIEGRVPSLTHKRLAGVFAWWIPGTADVINSVEVEPSEEDTDDELVDAVMTVLEKDVMIDPSSITVSAKDWVVTLGGSVADEEEKAAAENDAWYVWGVNDVVNGLKARRKT